MSEDTDDLRSIKVYKFNNTKEGWHEFALKFRVIADSRGYDDIIEGTETPPDEKENLEILDKDNAEVKKAKKAKQLTRAANKKGYRDLVMSTEGISLNIVENSTSDKLTKGDLRKAWGRLERCWNPKTREDKEEFYTKFLSYKLENVRQRPMDWLAFLERKRMELANTGHIMDDETFITHLLNSLPQAEYKGAILAIKERLRRGSYDQPEIEQILEDKYQSMKYVKGGMKRKTTMHCLQALLTRKGIKNSSREDVAIVESLDSKHQTALTRKVARKKVQRANLKKGDAKD